MDNSVEKQDAKAASKTSKKMKFTADRSCIPTLPKNEQEAELSTLDIQVYEQTIFEREILDQVNRAFKSHEEGSSPQENCLDRADKSEGECTEGDSSGEDETKENVEGLGNINMMETEREKKIRLGEMTPFGTVMSLKEIEGNHFENIEEYLKNQVRISNERKEIKRKNLLKSKKTKTSKHSNKPVPKKRKPEKSLENKDSCDAVSTAKEEKAHKSGSDSEYVPSQSDENDYDDGSDADFKLEPKPRPSRKRKRKTEKLCDGDISLTDSGSEYEEPKAGRSKGKTDDGCEITYLTRMEKWEKENDREEIESQLKDLGDGFKMPLIIWNKLYNYQKVGVQWLWELNLQNCGGIVGDEMGLGKTIQVIGFLAGLSSSKLLSRHGSYRGLGPVLIVCPTTVMHQWVREFHIWWPQFRVALLHESGTFSGRKSDLIREINRRRGILITSYVTCIQQSNELLRHTWHYVILDEGHKIRNPESQITHTVKMFKTPHRLILSGSPIQNNLKELWSLFDFIFPGKLGTLPVFLAEFGVPITQGGFANASKVQVATAFKCATVLRDTISPYLLRRAKEDVKSHINLPPKNEQVLFCKLTEEQKELYLNYLNSGKVAEMLNGKMRIFVGLIELRKICNHPHLYTGGPKISKWERSESEGDGTRYGDWRKAGKMIVLETVLRIWKKQGHRVLIFTQSRKMLAILEKFVVGQSYEYIKMDGSTTIGSRQPLINKFNENSRYFIFLSTTHVGGLGVNLTGANRVVIYDPDWNPATDVQARERAWRLGQENQVTIYRFVTSGTIEEKIYHRQIYKQFLTNKVLKDPSQRRFFKSNDLYELFTFKGDEAGNETSAIFAGTDFELNSKNLPGRKRKRRQKDRAGCEKLMEPTCVRDDVATQNLLTKEKIEKMKQMAQALSRQIALDAAREGGGTNERRSGQPESDQVHAKARANPDGDAGSSGVAFKKSKKRKHRDERLDGEVVPHLQKTKRYRELVKDAPNYEKDDDYILKKLFSKSGVQSALKHDQLMEAGSADYALIEGEAEKIAKEAVKALKESRRHYVRGYADMSSPSTFAKPRFGRKTIRQQPQNESEKNKFMSPQELMERIRMRNELCLTTGNDQRANPAGDNSELLTDIRNFISFGGERDNRATTQEIIDKFRDRLPTSQTPLFKALLNEICEFHRTSRGEGVWELRQDFRWAKRVLEMESNTLSEESRLGECESYWLVSGPPFDQRDYMISPSETSSCLSEEGTPVPGIDPCDVTVSRRYVPDSREALKKLVELLGNECTRSFTARMEVLIGKYLAGCLSGFVMEDVPRVVEVLEFFSQNKNSNPEFVGFARDIICAAKNPPIAAKSSDAAKTKARLADYFTVFGEILATFEDDLIQNRSLEVVERLLTGSKSRNPAAVKLAVCHEALEESQLPYAMAVLLETVSQDLYTRYLDVIIQIILISAEAGHVMMRHNLLNSLLWRLNYSTVCSLSSENPKNAEEETALREYYVLLEKSSYALWGLLTMLRKCDVDVPPPGEDALLSLRIVFERESIKKSQKALMARNNLAGLLIRLCAAFGDKLPVSETGLAVDIAVAAVATELGPQKTWMEPRNLGTKKEDYILKKLMMLGCCLIIKEEKCLETLKSYRVIEGLLHLVDPRKIEPWIPSQFITLFYTALRCLSLLVPLMPEAFVLNGGTAKLLSAMKWAMKENFDGNALLEIIETISVIVTTARSRCAVDDFLAQDGVKSLLDVCFYILGFRSIKFNDQIKLTRVFTALEKVLGGEEKLLAHHGDACTSIALTLLERILKDLNSDSKWHPQVVISFGGFVWETVARHPGSRASFIDRGGVFHLLDVIETNSFPVQMLFLGVLAEMSEDGESISHLNTWRGKNGLGVLDAMIDVWRREEAISKVGRTKDGVISDVEMPLMTEEQWYLTHQVRGSHVYSPSIAEMCCSARPKIHALYQFLQKKYADLTNLSESFYASYLNKVRPTYKLYVPLIENFLLLKMGEIWFEVLRDATLSGLIPMADDGDALSTLLDEKNKWSTRIKTMQEEILTFQRMDTAAKEEELYELLNANKFAYSLETLGELDFVARTSVKRFQEQRKKKQIREVEKSLRNLSPSLVDSNLHRTFMCKTNTTCFSGNYVKIKSEKEVAEHENVVVISSDESGDDRFDLDDHTD